MVGTINKFCSPFLLFLNTLDKMWLNLCTLAELNVISTSQYLCYLVKMLHCCGIHVKMSLIAFMHCWMNTFLVIYLQTISCLVCSTIHYITMLSLCLARGIQQVSLYFLPFKCSHFLASFYVLITCPCHHLACCLLYTSRCV